MNYQLKSIESLDSTISKIATISGCSLHELKSRKRSRVLVDTRMMLIKILKGKNNLTLISIGKILNRDHSTILYHLQSFDDKIKFNKPFLS